MQERHTIVHRLALWRSSDLVQETTLAQLLRPTYAGLARLSIASLALCPLPVGILPDVNILLEHHLQRIDRNERSSPLPYVVIEGKEEV